MGWLSDAPRAIDFIIEPGVIENDEHTKHIPAIGFAFKVPNADEPMTVVLLGREDALKLFQKKLNLAIEQAIKNARMRQAEANRERSKNVD
jgi:hypothetical protein